jgi:DNA-binding transcriptional LysR family regulator
MKQNQKEKLVFGATRTIGDFILPEKLAGYIGAHPQTDIRMLVDNTEILLKRMDEGELEFSVIEGYFPKSEYDYQNYSNERFIAVCGAAYPFVKKPKILSDLFRERIILREPGSGSREIFERQIEERNYSIRDFRQIIEIGSIHAIKSLVAAGCGITFLYEAAARPELKTGLLRTIPLADFEVYHPFSMIWRKNSIYKQKYREIFNRLLRR